MSKCVQRIQQSFKVFICLIYFSNVNQVKILVPGCGLGRLSYELSCRGYECEANEFSYFMLIASNFVLNNCSGENMYTLHPWVHQHDNNLRRADQAAAVRFPDVCPLKNKPTGALSVVAGDFLEVKYTLSYEKIYVMCCLAYRFINVLTPMTV